MKTIDRLARGSLILATVLTLTACSAHMVSRQVSSNAPRPDKEPVHGLFYTLPQTVVRITLPMTLSETKVGEYEAFAELFFPGEKLTAARSLEIKQPTFETRGLPDPRHVYYMRVDGRGAMEQTLTLTFTEQGAVTGLKAVTTNRTADVVLSTVGSVTNLLAKAAIGGGVRGLVRGPGADCTKWVPLVQRAARIDETMLERHLLECFLAGSAELQRNFERFDAPVGDAQRQAQLRDAKKTVLEAYSDVDVSCANPACTQTTEVKREKRLALEEALKTYQRYTDLAKKYNESILFPENAMEGYGGVLDRIEVEMKGLRGKFVGVKQSDQEWTGVLDVLPDECDPSRASPCPSWPPAPSAPTARPLLEFLPDEGICKVDLDALAGSAPPSSKIMVRAKEQPRCAKAHRLFLTLTLDPANDQLVTRIAHNYQRPAEAGLHYIVPARMKARLEMVPPDSANDGSATCAEAVASHAHLMIAQHGIVTAMPSKLGGKAMTHDVAFYDASGALKSFNLVSTPMIDKGVADSLGNAANTLLDARLKREKEEAAAADPFNQLKKEKDTLEALLAIQKACAELENPPEECGV